QIREKEQHATDIEDKVAETVEKLQEQIDLQADRIRELSAELNERNQTVAHLSSQRRHGHSSAASPSLVDKLQHESHRLALFASQDIPSKGPRLRIRHCFLSESENKWL
ncbi:hypothetical protein OESDEN_17599, partial [Oesophagostomum dentatum]